MGAKVLRLRIQTPSRLHFGLLLPGPGERRRYGGLGLALAEPRFVIEARPAETWGVSGPDADRAKRCLDHLRHQSPLARALPMHIHLVETIPAHVGLGSGTQLACALAWLVARAADLQPALKDLLRWTGRGTRSAIGAAAFASGGFIVDLGKHEATTQGPTFLRLDFPHDWHVALLLPDGPPGLHGPPENAVFSQLSVEANRLSERLCRLTMLQLLPALVEHCYEDFAAALSEYNRLAGECFRPWQSGSYHSDAVARIIAIWQQFSPVAVGQSSWGPAVFVIAPPERLRELLARTQRQMDGLVRKTIITTVSSSGARTDEGRSLDAVLQSPESA
ncbi:MAG: hypothetical protein NZM42_10975 [Gemmatales bacterium]|nr:hypothetical protein [Gemmatales bacterium]MDW8224030.1 hypothetical protein [Gemmatales bacterium]